MSSLVFEERSVLETGKSFYDPVQKANIKTTSKKLNSFKLQSKDIPIKGEKCI